MGLRCAGGVLVLAVHVIVDGFRTRAFEAGRGKEPRVVAVSSNPVGYWTAAAVLSVTSGGCLGFILYFVLHR